MAWIFECLMGPWFSIAAGLYGDLVGHSDFEMNLRPPGTGKLFIDRACLAVACALQTKARSRLRNRLMHCSWFVHVYLAMVVIDHRS